jgi:hypothetical protein
MAQRGRKSAASLQVITSEGLAVITRPEPPEELTDEQAHEWRCIVNRLPAEWFPTETHGLLSQYCRHVVAARRVAQLVEAMEAKEEFDIEDYDRLLKMQEREGRAMSSLATRMRISQQSTLDREKRKPVRGSIKPPHLD